MKHKIAGATCFCNFCLTAFALLLLSCGSMNDVSLEDLSRPVLKSLAGRKAVLEIGVRVNNPTGHRLYLKKGEFEIFNRGYSFGRARLLERTEIPEYSNDYQTALLEITVTDALAIMKGSVHSILSDENMPYLTFSGYIKGGTKLISKKYRFEDMPLGE